MQEHSADGRYFAKPKDDSVCVTNAVSCTHSFKRPLKPRPTFFEYQRQ